MKKYALTVVTILALLNFFIPNPAYAATDMLLIVACTSQNAAGDDVISSATYNGTALTKVNSIKNGSDSQRAYIFYLIAPASGTHSITINLTETGGGNDACSAADYSGAKQSAQPDASVTSNTGGNQSSLANTLTTVADKSIHAVSVVSNTGCAISAGAGTQFVEGSMAVATWGLYTSSPIGVTPAGSHTDNISHCSQQSAMAGASFAPDAGGVIALDTVSQGQWSSGTSFSWSHTVNGPAAAAAFNPWQLFAF